VAETVPGTFAIRLQLLLTFFFTDKLLSEGSEPVREWPYRSVP